MVPKSKVPGFQNSLQWYYDRVGKRIRRVNGNNGCKCPVCKSSRTAGLIVHNKDWADHLYYLQEEQDYRYEDMDIIIKKELPTGSSLP